MVDKLPKNIRENKFLFLIAKKIFNLPEDLYTFRENYNNGLIPDLSKLYMKNSDMYIERTSKDTDINSFHIELIKENVYTSQPKSVLDVGCGTGYLLELLDQKLENCNLLGIDFSSPSYTQDYDRNEVRFISGDIKENLKSLESNSFDLVICAHVLEHLSNPQEIIIEMRRICKKRLILICPLEKPYKWGLNYHVQFFASSMDFLKFVRKDDKSSEEYLSYERLGDCMYIEKKSS